MNVLFFLQPGTVSRRIFQDQIRGFERAGHRAITLELEPVWRLYERDPAAKARLVSDMTGVIRGLVSANRVDLSVGTWANGLGLVMHGARDGRPLSFYDAVELPHLMFWLDAPHWAHGGTFAPNFGSPLLRGRHLFHAINNPATGREMEEVLGFTNVLARGYGVDEETFRPHPDQRQELDLVFSCGPGDPAPTPAALEEVASDRPDMERVRHDAAERLLPALDALAARLPEAARPGGRDLVRALVRSQLESRDRPMLERLASIRALAGEGSAVARAADALRADPRLYVELTMKLRGIEAMERALTISYLSRHLACGVFGAGGGELASGGWGCRARVLGDVRYEDMARAYASARVALNVMRWQDDEGLNVKPYEITASGAPCLCAARAGLDRQFEPGREVIAFGSPREALERARELIDSPGRRREVAEAGRARTLRDHTWTAWAGDLTGRIASTLGRSW